MAKAAQVRPETVEQNKSPRAITSAEWEKHRKATMSVLPAALAGRPLPDVLMPYQAELLRTTSTNRVTLVEKSRRTGYTWGVGADAVLTAGASKGHGGMDVLYIGYNLEMAREFVDVCDVVARDREAATEVQEMLFDDGDADAGIKAFRVGFASGFEIIALSSKPRSLRGKQGYVILDEAAFHDDLRGMMKAALALLIWGGKVLVISTHEGDDNFFNELVTDVRAGRKPYALLRCDFDRALEEGLYQRVCLATGDTWSPEAEATWRTGVIAEYGEDADEELFCIPARGKGAFLPAPLIEARMVAGIPVLRWEQQSAFAEWPEHLRKAEALAWCEEHLFGLLKALDPKLMTFLGEDFGRISDLTVLWPLQLTRMMRRVTPFIVELRNIPFEQQKQILFYICDRLPRFHAGAMDATGNGAFLAEVAAQRYGMGRIDQVKLSTEWYRENMPRMKAQFEDNGLDIPKDADVLSDFRALKLINGIGQLPNTTRAKGSDGKNRHGDSAIALALAIYASIMPVTEYDYTSGRVQFSGDRPRDEDGGPVVKITGGFSTKEGLW
ncbi:MAG: hypothetical protein IPL91_14360 [Hyphomicrobium sp.]|nr:hypothetical protein [Hyphomicrobium sp.]